jgi:hypothetical protein
VTPEERLEKALDELVDETKAETTPQQIEWDTVEATLMRRVQGGPISMMRERATSGRWVAVLAAAALVAGALLWVHESHVSAPVAPLETAKLTAPAELPHWLDGDAIGTGAVVASDDREVVVEHRERATWTLAPKSSALVESTGDVITVALNEGSVSAHVVKSPRPESFVVRVEKTRIAVHGTRFRVDRLGTTVHVELAEGVIAVGPVGGPEIELFAPSNATLSLDGLRLDTPPTSPRPTARQGESSSAPPAKDAAKAGTAPAEDVSPEEKAKEDAERTMTDGIRACLAVSAVSRGDLRVSVETRMAVHVLANGHVEQASFAPPLSPAVRRCADAVLARIVFPPSDDAFVIEQGLQLDH